MPLRGNPLSPSGRRRRRGGLSGPSRQNAFGCSWAAHGILTSGRATERDAASAGEAEVRVLVANLKRVGGTARNRLVTRSPMPWSAGRLVSSERRRRKRMREGTGSRFHGVWRMLWRGPETHESIGPPGFGPGRARIPAGSNALEPRGTMISWSSEQENVMSETARGHRRRKTYGSAGGKSSVGWTPRAAPILEIGRHAREEAVKRVRNPEDGTNRVWKPG